MSRSVTDFQVCYWEEDWQIDRRPGSYVGIDAPIKFVGLPSWWSDLDTEDFWGVGFHSMEVTVSATEGYRMASGVSEHLIPDSTVYTITESYRAEDFSENVIYGPTTVTTTKTAAELESTAFPFLRSSFSIGGSGGGIEPPWFECVVEGSGVRHVSPITWYGQTLNWPEVEFEENFEGTVNGGPYDGETAFGAVILESGGSISNAVGGFLTYYVSSVRIVGEGPNAFRVKCNPVDMDGQEIGGEKKAYVLSGPLYTVERDEEGIFRYGSTVSYASFTGDASDYCDERTLPIDEDFSYPLRLTRWDVVVRIDDGDSDVLSGLTPPAPGWLPGPPPGFDGPRFEDYENNEVRSRLNEIQVVLDKEDFFGLPAAPRRLANFDNQHPGVFGLHRFHEAAQSTQKEVATISQAASKTLGSGFFNFLPTGGAFFEIDGSTMVFTSGSGASSPSFFLNDPGVFNFRPYRYLSFDYDVESGGSVSVVLKLNDQVSTRAQKEYHFTLTGSGTKSVDLCWPSDILTSVGGEGATLMASRLNTENQADRTGVTDSAYAGTGQPLKERFTGVRGCKDVTITFSKPSVVRITNFRKTVNDQARVQFNHWTQQKSDIADAGAWGDIDFKDAYRVSHNSTAIKAYLDKLSSQQSMTVMHGTYTLPSTWVSPTTAETLGALNFTVGTVYGWFSQFTSEMEWIGKRNVLETIPVWVTLGMQALKGYTGIGQSSMFAGLSSPLIVQTEFVVGSLFSMTAFKRVKGTKARIYSSSGLGTIDEEYASELGGYGSKALPRYRPDDIAADPDQTQTLEHYIPKHPDPETKQLVYGTGARNVFWIGVQGVPESGPKVSYDVHPSLRHYRAWVDADGIVHTSFAGNDLDWTDLETEIQAESLCLRVEKRSKEPRLYLWVGTAESKVVLYTSENEGNTWEMSFEVGDGTMPFADISVDGKRYVYWFDGTDILGKIYDAGDNVIVPEFTAISGVEEEGACARESVTGLGQWRMIIQAKVGDAITQFESENGVEFS